MCTGPVGDKQSYWGVIQIKISGGELSKDDLDGFKTKLRQFLSGHEDVSSGLPANASASLANGTIKFDDEDGTSIQLINRSP